MKVVVISQRELIEIGFKLYGWQADRNQIYRLARTAFMVTLLGMIDDGSRRVLYEPGADPARKPR